MRRRRPRVAVTRDEAPDGPLARALADAGLDAVACPTIAIAPPEDPRDLGTALESLERFDWVVFTSAHAVDATCARPEWRRAAAAEALPRLAAVGAQTARRLARFGHQPDVVPARAGAAALATALATATGTLDGARVLWPRADLARPELASALTRAGAALVAPVAYRTLPAEHESLEALTAAIDEGRVDAIAFCSPSSAEHLVRGLALPSLASLTEGVLVASIGPTTTAALTALGREPDVEAPEPSARGLALALAERLGTASGGRQ